MQDYLANSLSTVLINSHYISTQAIICEVVVKDYTFLHLYSLDIEMNLYNRYFIYQAPGL